VKAIFRAVYGSPDILELKEVDRPVPNENGLLPKVHAAAVNPMDWHILRGEPFLIRFMGFGLLKPRHHILGTDMAGQIEAVGKNVNRFKVGDEVFGSGIGGFAEYACIREDQAALKPVNLTYEQAAAVPVAGLTALQALRDHGRLQEGQHILINGASGGVGTFAVQIAKTLGAQVTGVCSGRNAEMVRSIGADNIIDYTKEDFCLNVKRYDLILDNVGSQPIGRTLQVLKANGIYVRVGGSSSTAGVLYSMISNPLIAKMKGRKAVSFIANVNKVDLAYIKELLEGGKIIPVIDKEYSLDEAPESIRYVEGGHARGKVIITI